MKQKSPTRKLMTTSVLLVLLALASITAATTAWMTIADRTRVRTMRMEITSGANLRFDLDPHEEFEEYVKTLSFGDISQRIFQEKGFDPANNPLVPVTTADCVRFTLEDGTEAKPEYYLEFTLHFMATEDMIVHLTSAGLDGTRISSSAAQLPQAMRLSFTAEQTSIYDPGMGDTWQTSQAGTVFGLPQGDTITYHEGNALFSLEEGVDKPVVIRVWLEGTDEACTDELRDTDYSIRLRFVGTDEAGNLLEDARAAGRTDTQKEKEGN
ncbi:MAG: hypothetical protein ACI3XG_11965 [Faecousia sp.]